MSEKSDPLVALLEQAAREGLLKGESLHAFASALRERAEIVIQARLRNAEEELVWRRGQVESLEQEVAWRRESFEKLLLDLERSASRWWSPLRLRRDVLRLVGAWRKDRP